MTAIGGSGRALLGRKLRLPFLEGLHDQGQTLGELALQDDAFVDDGGHALEQLAAGAELAILRARARGQPNCERGGARDDR